MEALRQRVITLENLAAHARAEYNDLVLEDIGRRVQAEREMRRDLGRNERAHQIRMALRRALALETHAADVKAALSSWEKRLAEAPTLPARKRKPRLAASVKVASP